MSKALDLLNKLNGKKQVAESTVQITKRFKTPAPAKKMGEDADLGKVLQNVTDIVNNFHPEGNVADLKNQVLGAIKGQPAQPGQAPSAPKQESKPKKLYRYEIPQDKIAGVAESIRMKLGEKKAVVEEKDDAVEVLTADDVEEIVLAVLKAVGLIDEEDGEGDEDEEEVDASVPDRDDSIGQDGDEGEDDAVIERAPVRSFKRKSLREARHEVSRKPAPAAARKNNPLSDPEVTLEEARADKNRLSGFLMNMTR